MRQGIDEAASVDAGFAPSRKMRAQFLREVADAGLPPRPTGTEPVSAREIEALPETVQRYLRFMGVRGRPRTWSFRLRSVGRFRLGPNRPWMPCEAWQYNAASSVTRIFHMRLRYGGLMPMIVRDTYVRGRGRMSGRLFDALSVVDQADEKIDIGELVTYLNDAVLFAPSMLLGPSATFSAVDDGCFDVALRDRGRSVAARVFIDERGAVRDFSTTDRFGVDPARGKEMVQARWSTPILGWTKRDDRSVPTGGAAVWHFPSGDFAYADFRFVELEFDVDP